MPVESKHTYLSLQTVQMFLRRRKGIENKWNLEKLLTITINVNSTGITLSIVVSVGLVSVLLENTVVTAVANVISVCVILGRVVHSWAVVLNL